jgi:membrane-associated phospholipid phosphatase
MNTLFYKLPQHIIKLFSGYNLLWHIVAVVLTYFIVTSGFDEKWFALFSQSAILPFFFLGAAMLGFVLSFLLPIVFLIVGKVRKNGRVVNTAWAIGQAALLGLFISWFYKAFTGRPGPELSSNTGIGDISQVFRFGFLRGGVFWGWPSTHTMIAVATMVTLIVLYPKSKKVIVPALLYAFYIGFGASISFHWLSDCIAGAIIGTVIGIVVGRSFRKRYNETGASL